MNREGTQASGPAVVSPPTPLRVLLAEDDEAMRDTVVVMLQPLPVKVQQATTGLELVQALASGMPFDLLITDVRMPWVNGLQAAMSLRSSGAATPVVVMSAFGDDALKRAVAGLGFSVFLDKPFSAPALREAIAQVLSWRP